MEESGPVIRHVTAPLRIDLSAGWPDSDPYLSENGGIVLNAAINWRVSASLTDKALTTCLPDYVPKNSGLGTSGALRSVYLAASNPELVRDPIRLIKRVHMLENTVLDHRAGLQDQAAAIFGGINLWTFAKDKSVERVSLPQKDVLSLQNKLWLYYTGEHDSGDMHAKVFSNYPAITSLLDAMKSIAKEMHSYINNHSDFAQAIKETWKLQRKLHEVIETPSMKEVQENFNGAYKACKACGAGGGGYLLFFGDNLDKITEKFQPVSFDFKGISFENKNGWQDKDSS